MRLRDELQMRHLQAMERAVRAGRFVHPNSNPEQSIKRLYFLGSIDTAVGDEHDAVARQFEAMWLLDQQVAKTIDWPRLLTAGDGMPPSDGGHESG